MTEVDAEMLQFILSVAKYTHSQRGKKDLNSDLGVWFFFPITYTIKDRGQS